MQRRPLWGREYLHRRTLKGTFIKGSSMCCGLPMSSQPPIQFQVGNRRAPAALVLAAKVRCAWAHPPKVYTTRRSRRSPGVALISPTLRLMRPRGEARQLRPSVTRVEIRVRLEFFAVLFALSVVSMSASRCLPLDSSLARRTIALAAPPSELVGLCSFVRPDFQAPEQFGPPPALPVSI